MDDSFSYVESFLDYTLVNFGVMIRSFSKNKHDFVQIITPNSTVSRTKMTYHKKMSHPFVDLDQSEASSTGPPTQNGSRIPEINVTNFST